MDERNPWMEVTEALFWPSPAPGLARCTCRHPGTGLPGGACRFCRLDAAEQALRVLISNTFLISRLLWVERLARNAQPAACDLQGWVTLGNELQGPPASEVIPGKGPPFTPRAVLRLLAAKGYRWQDERDWQVDDPVIREEAHIRVHPNAPEPQDHEAREGY